jgi:hypothetical protein
MRSAARLRCTSPRRADPPPQRLARAETLCAARRVGEVFSRRSAALPWAPSPIWSTSRVVRATSNDGLSYAHSLRKQRLQFGQDMCQSLYSPRELEGTQLEIQRASSRRALKRKIKIQG